MTIAFLTREWCLNSGTMRARLDEALKALGWTPDYDVVDADMLPENDRRRGYGVPTVLVCNRDLFGIPEQSTPHPPT